MLPLLISRRHAEKKQETEDTLSPLHVFFLSCLLHYYIGVARGEVGEAREEGQVIANSVLSV